jgi:UDP-glucose 4-epimerase
MNDLGWKPRHTDLDAIIRTAWNWFSRNPDRYSNPS